MDNDDDDDGCLCMLMMIICQDMMTIRQTSIKLICVNDEGLRVVVCYYRCYLLPSLIILLLLLLVANELIYHNLWGILVMIAYLLVGGFE